MSQQLSVAYKERKFKRSRSLYWEPGDLTLLLQFWPSKAVGWLGTSPVPFQHICSPSCSLALEPKALLAYLSLSEHASIHFSINPAISASCNVTQHCASSCSAPEFGGLFLQLQPFDFLRTVGKYDLPLESGHSFVHL